MKQDITGISGHIQLIEIEFRAGVLIWKPSIVVVISQPDPVQVFQEPSLVWHLIEHFEVEMGNLSLGGNMLSFFQ